MTEFQSNGKHYLAVQVPEGVSDFQIIHEGTRLAWFEPHYKRLDLPKGQYSILGLASEMSEEQWVTVIDKSVDNPDKYSIDSYTFYSAKTASAMLMDSLNLNPETTLIIEKI